MRLKTIEKMTTDSRKNHNHGPSNRVQQTIEPSTKPQKQLLQ